MKYHKRAIKINLRDASDDGRLFYKPDPDIEPLILFIKNPNQRVMAFSINIEGGQVLLALNSNRILQSAEFIIHRRIWKKATFDIPPVHKISADIEFPNVRTRYTEFELPVTVTTDEAYSFAHIIIGEVEPDVDCIALSDQCFVLVHSGYFKGFYIKLIS